ncbi:MAG: hypothetical protein ACYC5M_18850 [Anaerolineae bacterium]
MNLRHWIAERLFKDLMAAPRAALAAAQDPLWTPLNGLVDDLRPWHEQRGELERIAAVCRSNPLAARLVAMTTDFVVGSGATLEAPAWAQAFWQDPLNRMDLRVYRWCDELSRSGELFLVLARNPVSGMAYVREIPALRIDRIQTDGDDLERELAYHELTDALEGRWWPAAGSPTAEALGGEAEQVMLHYAINKPVGQVRGVSDLAQVLVWLRRYDQWLEDRVRINRYKGAYLWQVKVEGALPGTLEAKRAQYSRVPRPGSIIVTDGHETWTAVQPQIGADDVSADGRAIRMMIAAGVGVPLHFLAEGESANRATAREMGTATFRHFRHRQRLFAAMVEDVIRVAAARAGEEVQARVRFESVLAERPTGGVERA